MRRTCAFSIAFILAAGGVLIACGDSTPASGSGSAAGSGAQTAKPAPSMSASAAMSAMPSASATAAMSAMPSASASASAAVAVQGIKPGEIVGGACDTISKDSECGEFVVTAEADKAKSIEALKK